MNFRSSAVATAAMFCCAALSVQAQGFINHNTPTLQEASGHGIANVKLTIKSVTANATVETAVVMFEPVKGFELGIPTPCMTPSGFSPLGPGGGQYIELIVADGVTATHTRITTGLQAVVPLPTRKDSISIRAYLCYDDGECVKKDGAMDGRLYDAGEKKWGALPSGPIVTFNMPRQAGRMRFAMLDFHVRDFDTALYRVKVLVDGKPTEGMSLLKSWVPYDLDLVDDEKETRTIRLELTDLEGNRITAFRFNAEERTICVRK